MCGENAGFRVNYRSSRETTWRWAILVEVVRQLGEAREVRQRAGSACAGSRRAYAGALVLVGPRLALRRVGLYAGTSGWVKMTASPSDPRTQLRQGHSKTKRLKPAARTCGRLAQQGRSMWRICEEWSSD